MVMTNWPRAVRIIRSIYPPIDLFEDISDPRDWEAIASLESKTNPRIREEIGRLDLVPVNRRVGGPGASYVMAPFVHCSTDRPGRFTDGSYGVYSAANDDEVAIREIAYHHARTMAATNEKPGWHSDFRQLIGSLNAELTDITGDPLCHDPDDWSHPQALGRQARANGANGLLYNSVRCPGGQCVALFWPDIMAIPVQGTHYRLHWDGSRVDRVYDQNTSTEYRLTA